MNKGLHSSSVRARLQLCYPHKDIMSLVLQLGISWAGPEALEVCRHPERGGPCLDPFAGTRGSDTAAGIAGADMEQHVCHAQPQPQLTAWQEPRSVAIISCPGLSCAAVQVLGKGCSLPASFMALLFIRPGLIALILLFPFPIAAAAAPAAGRARVAGLCCTLRGDGGDGPRPVPPSPPIT